MSNPFLLVDGLSYLYRAFHAFPPLTDPKGRPVGGMFGFLTMLQRMVKQVKPTRLAIIWDPSGVSARKQQYPAYKQHRRSMPDALASQIGPLIEILTAGGLQNYQDLTMEADDVIASLAQKLTQSGEAKVLIASSDKDLAQLVSDGVSLVDPHSFEILDRDAVIKKYGIAPEQVIDWLALKGDAADNIPGVAGIGEKTAQFLLKTFSTLDAIYDRIEEIPHQAALRGAKSVQTKLILGRSQALLSKSLATLHYDLSLPSALLEGIRQPPNFDVLCEHFKESGFKQWLKHAQSNYFLDRDYASLNQKTEIVTPEAAITQFQIEDLDVWLAQAHEGQWVALSWDEVAESVLLLNQSGGWIQWDPKSDANRLQALFANPEIIKIALDWKQLFKHWSESVLQALTNYWDLKVAAYVLGTHQPNSLKDLWDRFAPDQALNNESPHSILSGFFNLYASQLRAFYTLPQLLSLLETLELPLIKRLSLMERWGVYLDRNVLETASSVFGERLSELTTQIHTLAGESFNLNSSAQFREILFSKLGLPIQKKTGKGEASTNEAVLAKLAKTEPIAEVMLEYRALQKLKSTYTDGLLKLISSDHRVHTSFQQTVTSTGRLSSTQPNLQNIPIRTELGKAIRRAFIAPSGYQLVCADYSQIELRVLAHFSQDAVLKKAFAENVDLHCLVASELENIPFEAVTKEQRRQAKTINFGIVYGMNAYGLSERLNISIAKADHYIKRYFARYPKVKGYLETISDQALKQGYVETLLGRRIYVGDVFQKGLGAKAALIRHAVNAPMQGSAADIIKRAMVQLSDWLDSQPGVKLTLQIHDELIFEVEENQIDSALKHIVSVMESCTPEMTVPLKVNTTVAKRWSEPTVE